MTKTVEAYNDEAQLYDMGDAIDVTKGAIPGSVDADFEGKPNPGLAQD